MRQRGTTLVELMTGLFVTLFAVFGAVALLLQGVQSFANTGRDADLTGTNAQGIRRVGEAIRSAMSITVSTDGTQINYVLPKKSTSLNTTTGEYEYAYPLVSDGVTRYFKVNFTTGKLTDSVSGRTLVRYITNTDPLAGSTQYGQVYAPFSVTTIGSARAVTINLITKDKVGKQTRFVRLKTTAMVRN